MPLEATMIVLDTSEYMRNGDYAPTRFGAQTDAATAIFRTKIDANQENTVGVMTMAGRGPEVLVTHTKETGELLSALHTAQSRLGGAASIPTAIAIAQLALKHRQNKNLRQRVLVFVGSPLADASPDAERSLVRLARKLKKNNVALDVVAFGDGIELAGDGGHSILKAFVDAASSSDNSHYIAVPSGTHLLSDAVLSSAVLAADRSIPDAVPGGEGAGDGAGGDFAFGVDPSLDPELAMALRMSMDEEAARQAAAATASTSSAQPASTATAAATEPAAATDDEDERLLQQALALSEGRDVDMDAAGETGGARAGASELVSTGGVGASAVGAGAEDEEMTEEEMIARAIEMSMQGEGEDGADGKGSAK